MILRSLGQGGQGWTQYPSAVQRSVATLDDKGKVPQNWGVRGSLITPNERVVALRQRKVYLNAHSLYRKGRRREWQFDRAVDLIGQDSLGKGLPLAWRSLNKISKQPRPGRKAKILSTRAALVDKGYLFRAS